MKGESNGDWREREMDRNSVIESIILVDFFFFFFLKTNLGRISTRTKIKIIPSEKREKRIFY